jgi:uncharacterized membrane protein YdjX (TVP38/TMEM64 family)
LHVCEFQFPTFEDALDMSDYSVSALTSESLSLREKLARSGVALGIALLLFIAYRWSGLGEMVTPASLAELRFNLWAPALIIIAMSAAWAFALPASAFLFITPLLFPPHWSALITTAGCALGTTIGYLVARYVGGPWVERFRDGTLHRFLKRHSSFMVLFAIRLTPSSPHGFINYGAGLAEIPLARFVFASTIAMALKSYVYAEAIHNTVGAKSLFDALTPKTMLSLFAVAVLALAGHFLHSRILKSGIAASTSSQR